MKFKPNPFHGFRCLARQARGFALIITISLMVLLSLLAVGLLTLSSISLRGSSSGDAMQEARTNARMALALAIGQLQKEAGRDDRITAPAPLTSEYFPLGVTGVWDAWERGDLVEAPDDKESRFKAWLTSGAYVDSSAAPSSSRPPIPPEEDENAVTLLGENALGEIPGREAELRRQQLRAYPIGVSSGTTRGRLAWMTVDESVKARFDLEDQDELTQGTSLARKVSRAAAPSRLGVFALDYLSELRPDDQLANRLASFDTAVMGTQIEQLRSYRPDLTPWSVSLMTDPVDGGFKQDFSTLASEGEDVVAEMGTLYDQAGLPSNVADPRMRTLAEYHNLYQHVGESTTYARRVASGEMGATLPRSHRPYTVAGSRLRMGAAAAPDGQVLMPSIVRVDMIFSLVARDPHGRWATDHRAAGRQYMLHLLYLPVVTIHNPYDIPLVFDSMNISFKDVPIGFKFYINNRAMTNELLPLNNLYIDFANSNSTKTFGMDFKSDLSGRTQPIRLEPGQTRLFGTPGVSPDWTWNDESAGSGKDGAALFDWRNDKTVDFDILPRLITQSTTSGAGFDVDWLAGRSKTAAAANSTVDGTIGLKVSDRISVEWGPVSQPDNEFSVQMTLNNRPAGIFRLQYGNEARLKEIVEEGTSVRYPDERSFPAMYPDPDNDPPLIARDIYERSGETMADYVRARPFALFSFSGKTTVESFVPARPYADSSTGNFFADIDLSRGKEAPGDQPYELVMMPIQAGTSVIEENRAEEEGYFFGGNGSLYGSPRATFYEVPRAPLQSLAQFRHANLANSGVHPFMTYTVGESWAHPEIPTDQLRSNQTSSGVGALDHTYLCNTALWDHFFLSTMCDYDGDAFSSESRDAETVRQEFFEGKGELLNPRFVSLVSKEEAGKAAKSLEGRDGPRTAGRYLGLAGGFNVNSTSVDAWMALLSSLRETQIACQEKPLVDTGALTPFPRVRYPAGTAVDGQGSDPTFGSAHEPLWQGFRQIDHDHLRELAENLVDQVRERGPFLSLSEFVNRRLGPSGDEASLRGAIASAIEKTDINHIAEGEGIELAQGNLGEHDWASPGAVLGSNTVGAPCSLTQGDVLTALGSQLTVRGDTFVVRAYGESDAKTGQPRARAWCEAVVQRMPDFVDPSDTPETRFDELSEVNETFGRRFEMRSFRWLAPGEI
ncbi:hypothetical protein [Haloferula sargassicola]|uniref:Verru_Chthon cassette protein A n=1 Tax=Haloferula sargassicola TaxID=490096 RepID=A0ABP9UT08_9BACT